MMVRVAVKWQIASENSSIPVELPKWYTHLIRPIVRECTTTTTEVCFLDVIVPNRIWVSPLSVHRSGLLLKYRNYQTWHQMVFYCGNSGGVSRGVDVSSGWQCIYWKRSASALSVGCSSEKGNFRGKSIIFNKPRPSRRKLRLGKGSIGRWCLWIWRSICSWNLGK